MNLSESTLLALESIITGDGGLSPYRSGPQLVSFFNQFGTKDTYGRGFPSRGSYTEDKLREFNGTPAMRSIIKSDFDLGHFIHKEIEINTAADYLNKFLNLDNYELRLSGKRWSVYELNSVVELVNPYENSNEITHIFIEEQINKCNKKLSEQDFDGAITNARSLLEAVLLSIEREIDPNPPEHDGNLPKLYRRVQNHLNLSPGESSLAEPLKQILSGLTSIVTGLSFLRNKISDSHTIIYKPSEHHAKLAINSAKTLCNFLFDTKEYQTNKKSSL